MSKKKPLTKEKKPRSKMPFRKDGRSNSADYTKLQVIIPQGLFDEVKKFANDYNLSGSEAAEIILVVGLNHPEETTLGRLMDRQDAASQFPKGAFESLEASGFIRPVVINGKEMFSQRQVMLSKTYLENIGFNRGKK